MVYIPTIHQFIQYSDEGVDLENWRSPDWRATAPTEGMAVSWMPTGFGSDGTHGSLQAWDPVTQKRAWQVPLPVAWNPGTLTTSGDLVFQGRADGEFVAYHAKTGEMLWSQHMGLGIAAPPITYAINGRQYIALLVGWGAVYAIVGGPEATNLGWSYGAQTRRLVSFSMAGDADMPALQPPMVPVPLDAPSFEVDQDLAKAGLSIYSQCAVCHGPAAIAAGLATDLRASASVLFHETFSEVVRGGSKRARGMPSYESFSDNDLKALRHYIRQQADLGLATEGGP